MKKLIFALVIGSLFFTACQDDEETSVDAKNYYQAYELEYNAAENETIARAFFKKKDPEGEFLELTNGAEIRVNETLLSRDTESSAAYYTSFNGLVDTNYFEYADKNGTVYTNEFYLSDVTPIGFTPNTGPFNVFSSYDVEWDGPPVRENEAVYFQIGYEGGGVQTIKIDKVGENSIDLEDKVLMEVGRGDAQMVIYRVIQQTLEDTNEAGGRIQMLYSSGLVPVTIE